MDKELVEILHNTQNTLFKLKEILEKMGIWEEVKKQIKD